jgi:hypothetical protein
MRESTWKGFITGAGAGLVACWAVDRFYRLARETSSRHALAPYCAGAVAGAAYGAFVLGRPANAIAGGSGGIAGGAGADGGAARRPQCA